MPAQGFRGPRQLWGAVRWSLQGVRAAWRHEASFRLEVLLAVVLVPVGLWLGRGALEQLALVAPILLLLAVELLNSAVETVVDLVSPQYHELAGRAKDMGSAAVFIVTLLVLLSWLLILAPHWL